MPTSADKGKFICFGVTPKALTGTKPGTEVIATTKVAMVPVIYASDPEAATKIEFATVKSGSADKTLTVANAGSGTLKVSGIAISNVVGDAYGRRVRAAKISQSPAKAKRKAP